MNFQFEFEYNAQERKRLDHLNAPNAVGPGRFGILWCLCFAPTVLCLMWLQMWSIVIAGVSLILMASFVPAIMKLRGTAAREFPRSIELTPVGKRETVGDTTTFVKWNATDEIIESEDDFLFSRNDRFTLLPKRAIDSDQFQILRDQIGLWRNQPQSATTPLEMYQQLFQSTDTSTWMFTIGRDDLVAATKSTSLRLINDKTFSFKNVQIKKGMPGWLSMLIVVLILKVGLLLIFASMPPNRLDLLPTAIFLCLNPFVLLVAVGYWIRWRGIRGVPRLKTDELNLRLFEGGWAIGNEDRVAFNKWNERSVIYLANEFVGIRSDMAIHVLPIRGFSGPDGVWQFIDRAIRLKKNWLERNSGEGTDTQTVNAVDNEEDHNQAVNPYRSPSVR